MAKQSGSIAEAVHSLEYATSMEAWEQVNELFLTYGDELFGYGATSTTGMAATFNIFIKIRKAWVDPEFDYGKCFGYREQKWTLLVNNYLNLNKLDLLRSKVRYFQSKYNQNYNISYLFDNAHDNGKGCLLAATFSRRLNDDIPVITMMLRSSEITKRLIFDLLLIQRMGEYVYGPDTTFMINIFATQMYCNTETLIMYDSHKSLKSIYGKLKPQEGDHSWVKCVKESYTKFKKGDPMQFSSYKVFLRTARCLQPDAFPGHYKPLLAKNLLLEQDDIEYPESCISFTERKKYKQKYLKSLKK